MSHMLGTMFGFAMKSVDKNMARPFARVKI